MKHKGHRLRLSDQYDVVLTWLGLLVLYSSPLLWIWRSFEQMSPHKQLWQGIFIGSSIVLLSLNSLMLLYQYVPYFKNKRDLRQVLGYLLDHQLYEVISRKDGKGQQLKLVPVYVKKLDRATLSVTVEMTGKVLSHLESFPTDLEKLFFADFKARNDFRSNRLFSKHAYSQFIFSDNKEAQRLKLEAIQYDPKRGIQLMEGEYWDFVQSPHLLLAGGTWRGKTIFLLCLLKVLATFSLVEICDPKKSDLSVLEHFKVFKGHVHSEIDDIMSCLQDAVRFMDDRYRQMGLSSQEPEKVKIGNNYQSYGLPPKFVLVDEWTAFIASLDIRKAREVDDLMAQLVLKGRQAGVFLIVAMQRPDAEYLSTNLRDNMVARLSLGRLSQTGYRMIFGEEYANKNYLFIKKKIGRGYAALDGGMPSEFFSPFIPFDSGFSFEEVFAQMKPLAASPTTIPKPSHSQSKTEKQTDEELFELSQLARLFQKSPTTLTRLLGYMAEARYEFTEKSGIYNLLDKGMLEEIIDYKANHPLDNWKQAVQKIMKENED